MPPAFEGLRKRVEEGSLCLTFILGLPRGGTTAVEKHLHLKLPFDANVNEPSLHLDLGMPAGSEEERSDMTFSAVLEVVERIEAELRGTRDLRSEPLRLLVKEVTNKVLPSMVPRWTQLAAVVLLVFRNPSLQLESRLKSIVDRVTSGALKPFGLDEEADVRKFAVHGQPLVLADASLDSGDGSERSFRQVYKGMVSKRNFAGLGQGLSRLASLHPFCADPTSQSVIWGSAAPRPALALHEFRTLPEELCDQLLSWRLGWAPLRRQLPHLAAHPHVLLLDFSSFQIAPDLLTAEVDAALRSQCRGWAEARQRDGARKAVSSGASFSLRGSSWDDAAWQAWYGVPCYGKVRQTDEVETVLKAPVPASHFPLSCLPAIKDALELYAVLLADPRAARPPMKAIRPYQGIDHLYDSLMALPSLPRGGGSDAQVQTIARMFLSGTLGHEPVNRPGRSGLAAAAQRGAAYAAILLMESLMLFHTACVYWTMHLGGALEAHLRAAATDAAGAGRAAAKSSRAAVPDKCLISVIVPCYNEEALIGTALHSVCCADCAFDEASSTSVEVVVVLDAKTSDATGRVVQRIGNSESFPFPLRCQTSTKPGRGHALSAGVAAARGHVYLFLHADCSLPSGWDTEVLRCLKSEDVHATAFRFYASRAGVERPLPVGLLLIERMAHLRSAWLQLPFGDQAVAISAARLQELGGVPQQPILEDYSLMLRLMWHGGRTGRRVHVLGSRASSDPRRFQENGFWVTSMVNNAAILGYLAGVPLPMIFRWYYGRAAA